MDIKTALGILHIVGVAIGVGGATISDIFFIRILKSRKITKEQFADLEVLSRVVWAGITLLIVSGIGFLWKMYATSGSIGILNSDKFVVKLMIVGVIVLNGLVFRYKIFPKIKSAIGQKNGLKRYINWFAVTGAISITSWYTIVIYSVIRGVTQTFTVWLSLYIAAVVVAVQVARMMISFLLSDN